MVNYMLGIPQILPAEAKEKLDDKNGFIIIDVREDKELRVVSIDGANHIRMGEIVSRINEIPKEKEIGVLCHSGQRSEQVTRYLIKNGFNAVNIQGGIDYWARTVDPSLPRY